MSSEIESSAFECGPLIKELLDTVEPAASRPAAEVVVCVADEHPVLVGRVRCAFERAGATVESWLPCLATVRPRSGDRVLVMRPDGALDGIVVGVVDGFRRRVEPDPRAAHVRRIKQDEVVRIENDEGVPILEVLASDAGSTVRLLSKNVAMEAAGELRLEAESVAIVARQGGVDVRATDDVKLNGEQIHLN